MPLPTDFRRISSLFIGQYEAQRSNPAELHRLRNYDAIAPSITGGQLGQYYTVSGPSQDDASQNVGPQLETFPDWREGQTYSLLYVTQPPDLGDPDDPADDAVVVDFLMEPVVRAVVARAGIRSLSRDDNEGRARLEAEYARATAEFDPARAVRAGGVRTLQSYDRGRYARGRW